ncbi:MAG: hypothetical protein RLZZ126_1133 [Pseudomonadota bacterium]|jgi:lipopolysaccharide export system permease protein
MLFHSSIRKELARSFGASFIVLVTVVMTMTLIRTLGQASRGSFNPSDVMLVVGYTVLTFLPNVVTMALFISVVGTLSRLYRDSEMVIWFGSGTGLRQLVGPVMRFAWPAVLAIGALSLFAYPWANRSIDTIREQYEQRGDLERVEPGRFQESADGKRVFFVEKNADGERTGANVFIATQDGNKETVTTARNGRIEFEHGAQVLVLRNGQRMERTKGQDDMKISSFEEYRARVDGGTVDPKAFAPLNAVPSLDLLMEPKPRQLGELFWRIGFAVAALNLMVLAVATSRINPRMGRTGNLVFALFAFQVYLNGLNLGQNWIAQGRFGFWELTLLMHGGVLLMAGFWLAKQHNNWGANPLHWFQSLPGSSRTSP